MNQQTIKPQYTIATNRYGHYCIPLSSAHRPCAQTILAGDVHEPDTIRFILDHCGDGDVIHAGAYFGDMLPALYRSIKYPQQVWAFEPGKDNFKCAEITIRLNDLNWIEGTLVFNYALGEMWEDKKIYLITEDRNGISLGGGSFRGIPATGQYEISKVTSVDYLVRDHINVSVIHLDIEGSEQLALTGAMDTITRCKPILILETLPSSKWIEANLTNLGYKITGKVHSNSILECVK